MYTLKLALSSVAAYFVNSVDDNHSKRKIIARKVRSAVVKTECLFHKLDNLAGKQTQVQPTSKNK